MLYDRMNGDRDRVKELVDLYETNVNEKKRKEVLDGMLNHPDGHVLAEEVFRRADCSVFLSARNQLIPNHDFYQDGEYDSILDPAHCKSILTNFGSDDYVFNLLRVEFNQKRRRDPCSLSDIARIVDERNRIKREIAAPRYEATLPAWVYHEKNGLKIGSKWVRTKHYKSLLHTFRL